MLDYKLVEALAAVIDEGGFERAARRLNLTQSAVSQRIRQLEEALGGPALTRTQPPAPTRSGRLLLRHARRVDLLEAELARGLNIGPATRGDGDATPWRTVAVAVNADSLATWFLDAVLPILTPGGLTLDLRVDDQERTHEMLRAGEVAGCVSTRPTAMQGCRVVPLGRMRYICACSPDFAARWFPEGFTLAAVRRAPAVVFNRRDMAHDRFLASLFGESPTGAPRHHVPDSERFVDFIAGGAGFGMSPHMQAAKRLACGALVDLTPRTPMDVPLYWHCWNIPSPTLDGLGRALREAAGRALLPPEDSGAR